MKITTLDEIIEYNVDDDMYVKEDDFRKRKFLKNTLPLLGTCDGKGHVTLDKEGVNPPQILKNRRTPEERERRKLYGEKDAKFSNRYLEIVGDNKSNTLTTFATDNYVWDRNKQVRYLTNKEAFRLMDVDPDDCDKIISVVPKSQCMKLAGNSIVVNCLTEIFRELLMNPKDNKTLW